jgi:DNA anti-recombination protein RmuC
MKMYDDYSTIINYNRMDEGGDIIMEQILTAIRQLDNRFNQIDDRFNQLEDRMELKFEKVTEQLDRMETTLNIVAKTANDDTVAILERIDRNTKSLNQDIEFLSEQSGRHEMYFNRINND